MILQLDFPRFLFTYFVGTLTIISSIFFIYKILKRKKMSLSLFIIMSSFTNMISMILNMVYIHIFNIEFRILLYKIMIFSFFFGIYFVLFFSYQIYSEMNLDKRNAVLSIGIYSLLLFLILSDESSIIMNSHTNWNANWNPFSLISLFFLILLMFYMPFLNYSIKTLKKFRMQQLKKRWKFYVTGISGTIWVVFGGILAFSTNISLFIGFFGL